MLFISSSAREVLDLAIDLAFLHHAVWRDQEAVVINVAVNGQRRDQTDVRCLPAFRSGRFGHSAKYARRHFQSRRACGSSRPVQGPRDGVRGSTAERIGLVNHLRQFAAAEEKVNRTADALAVDQLSIRATCSGRILQAHALLHRALQLQESLAQFLRGQFFNGAQTAVTQVIDIVDEPSPLRSLNMYFSELTRSSLRRVITVSGHSGLELAVDAEAADAAEAVKRFSSKNFSSKSVRAFSQLRRITGRSRV